EALVRVANEKDGSDNITAVVGVCRKEDVTSRTDFENHATHQIVIKDETVDIYDCDTEVDIPRPSARQLRDADSPTGARGPSASAAPTPTWRTWLTATLVAATLGLLASYLVEHSRGETPARLEDSRSLSSSQ
ncbi:MAG: hypothetical protein AAFY88_28635, partial [Acidobacteriota bacterium]